MGALLVFKPPLYRLVTLVLVSYFAMYHGYAHAVEFSPGEDEQLYLSGFVLSTVILHGIGMLAGQLGQKQFICVRMLTGLVSMVFAMVALTSY